LKSKLFLIFLVLVLAASIVAPLNAQTPQPNLVIDLTRVSTVGQYGVVRVVDQFKVMNNGTSPVSYLDFAIPRTYRANLYYAAAQDSSESKLMMEGDVNKTSQFYWMRVHFAQDLGLNKTYTFTVTSSLGGMITSTAAGYEFNFTAAPILAQDARSANVTFLAPQGSTMKAANSTDVITTVSGYPAAGHSYKPWKAYSSQMFAAIYGSVNQDILNLKSVTRQIIIGNDGSLSVSERYDLSNPSVPITSLTITLPNGAYNVMAYDDVGALWTAPQNPTSNQVQVQPRYSSGIRSNENFTFTLTYNVPQSKYISQLNWWGSYKLNFTLLDNQDDFLFDNASVRMVMPDGVTIKSLNITPQSPVSYPIQISPDQRSFQLQGATDLMNLNFQMAFNYGPFWSAFPFLPWITALEVVIVAFALVVRIRRGPELEVPVPVENLRQFVGLYDERLALTRELVLMEEEVSRGGMVKHEYRRRTKVMELRLDELNKALNSLKVELRTVSPHYEELLRRLDRAEAEIQTSRVSMNQVRSQYRAGRLTRETYDALTKDIAKRIDRAEETLESSLITLREEAR
jgi:hypothetical protein